MLLAEDQPGLAVALALPYPVLDLGVLDGVQASHVVPLGLLAPFLVVLAELPHVVQELMRLSVEGDGNEVVSDAIFELPDRAHPIGVWKTGLSGLGWPLAAGYCQLLGGSASVDCSRNKSIVFEFRVPLVSEKVS